MVRRASALIAALGVVAVTAIAPAAQGDGVSDATIPAGAVVRVGDAPITRSVFDRWFGVAAASDPATRPVKRAYDPPAYVRCAAAQRKAARKAGRSPKRAASYRATCRQQYESLRDETLQFLILERWVAGEAAELGVAISAADQEAAFQKTKHESFPKESQFRRFLKVSGMTVADARFQSAFNLLYERLRAQAIAAAPAVTDADVAAYYAAHVTNFADPPKRDLRIVLARTRAKADTARAALRRGQTWSHVAAEYSIDQASKRRGGRLKGVVEGTQEKAFDEAIFGAPKGKLRGPVRTQFGWYVFEVVKITAGSQQTLAQAAPAIRRELTTQRRQAAGKAFDDGLRAEWRPRTVCRTGFITSDCSNGPLPVAEPPEPDDPDYPDAP